MRKELRCIDFFVSILLIAASCAHGHQSKNHSEIDNPVVEFLNAKNEQPLRRINVNEHFDPLSNNQLKAELFSTDSCEVKDGHYSCCTILKLAAMDVREPVCIDFSPKNRSTEISTLKENVELFETTLSVGMTRASMTQRFDLKPGDYLQNISFPLCIPWFPVITVCVNVHNITYDFTNMSIRSCFMLTVGIVNFPINLFALDLDCIKYANRTIVKEPLNHQTLQSNQTVKPHELDYPNKEHSTFNSQISDLRPNVVQNSHRKGVYFEDRPKRSMSSVQSSPDRTTDPNLKKIKRSPQSQDPRPVGQPAIPLRQLETRKEKRDVPKLPPRREYLPDDHRLRNRQQQSRQFLAVLNLERTWPHQFFIR
nr:PREDICTED: uncharacterized protein LOC109038893 isoform X2 [Bemisia tabaci]